MVDIYPKAYLRDRVIDFKEANLSIASSAVLYGLSTYTVMPAFKTKDSQIKLFRLSDHVLRLKNSAKILSFNDFLAKWDENKIKAILADLIKLNKIDEDCLIRIMLFVDGILSGTKMIDLPHQLAVFIYKSSPILPKDGARLMVSSWRRTPDNAIPARAKVSGSYVNASLMKNEALSLGYDDAIALDDGGHVTESTVSNFFIVKNDQLITPSASSDLLEGLTRDTINNLAKDLGIKYMDKTLDRSELYTADEAFLSGTSVAITPVISIDGRDINGAKTGSVTKSLMESYDKLTHGDITDKYHWLSPAL